ELIGKISLSPPPVDQQVLNQKTGNDHSDPVMHPSGLVQLPHSRIHNGKACFAPAPAFKLPFVVSPGDQIIFWLKTLVHHPWKVEQDHHKKLPPYQFIQP